MFRDGKSDAGKLNDTSSFDPDFLLTSPSFPTYSGREAPLTRASAVPAIAFCCLASQPLLDEVGTQGQSLLRQRGPQCIFRGLLTMLCARLLQRPSSGKKQARH